MLPSPNPPLVASYKGDQCWVCGKYFIDHPKGTEPNVIRNEHHIVPRAYGGLNGPTVMLCSAHHDLLHSVALSLIANEPLKSGELMRGMPHAEAQRVMWLASTVHRAHVATADDPNKRGQVNLTLAPAVRRELESLCALYSTATQRMSQARMIESLIRAQYRKDFPLSNT